MIISLKLIVSGDWGVWTRPRLNVYSGLNFLFVNTKLAFPFIPFFISRPKCSKIAHVPANIKYSMDAQTILPSGKKRRCNILNSVGCRKVHFTHRVVQFVRERLGAHFRAKFPGFLHESKLGGKICG